MSAGFLGGYSKPTYLIGGTTILDEDRDPYRTEGGKMSHPPSEEQLIAIQHTRTCKELCITGSREPRCAACGMASSDLGRSRDYCYGCGHLTCVRHQFWPNRKHRPQDHGPATGTLSNPRKYL